MNSDLTAKLFDKYPTLFAQYSLPPSETCMCWGIECHDGWYQIIDRVCETIMKWDIHKPNGEVEPKPEFTQVKEKYGALRVYHTGDDRIDGIVALAETLSEYTCEVCGRLGKMHHAGDWYSVRCAECYELEQSVRGKDG